MATEGTGGTETARDIDDRLVEQMDAVTTLILNGPLERFARPELAAAGANLYSALAGVLGRGR